MSSPAARRVVVDSDDLTVIFGANDENLRSLEEILGVRASARGNVVHLEGSPEKVDRAQKVLAQMQALQAEGLALKPQEVRAASRLLAENPDYELRRFFVDGSVRVTSQRQVSPTS